MLSRHCLPDVINPYSPPCSCHPYTCSTRMKSHLYFKMWSEEPIAETVHLVAKTLGLLESVDACARGSVPNFHCPIVTGRNYQTSVRRPPCTPHPVGVFRQGGDELGPLHRPHLHRLVVGRCQQLLIVRAELNTSHCSLTCCRLQLR